MTVLSQIPLLRFFLPILAGIVIGIGLFIDEWFPIIIVIIAVFFIAAFSTRYIANEKSAYK